MPQEMIKLRQMLDNMGIEWEDVSCKDVSSYYVTIDLSIYRTHFEYKGRHISVITGHGTYGGNEGLLEMWDGNGEPEGWLTAKKVIERIKAHELTSICRRRRYQQGFRTTRIES